MVKKKDDLGDMVWVKYGGNQTQTEYPAYFVLGNTPDKVMEEETGKFMVEVEWNTGYNSRDWVYVEDILPKSSMATGEVGRGQRAKQTPQEAMAKKEEEMAAWLAARRPPAPAKKKTRIIKSETPSIINVSSSSAQEQEDDDSVVDLCSSNNFNATSVSSEEVEDDEEEDEVEYIKTRPARTKPPGVVTVIEPYGLYDPRINYDDESDDDESDDDDDMDVDEEDYDDSNASLASGSDSEEEQEEEDSFRKGIRTATTKAFERAPPGTLLQTINETVHANLGIKEVTFVSYFTIAKQVELLMKPKRRPRPAAYAK